MHLQCRIVVVVDVINANHFQTAIKQHTAHIGTNEAGGTGDQDRFLCLIKHGHR